jgi:hypothetical protein
LNEAVGLGRRLVRLLRQDRIERTSRLHRLIGGVHVTVNTAGVRFAPRRLRLRARSHFLAEQRGRANLDRIAPGAAAVEEATEKIAVSR